MDLFVARQPIFNRRNDVCAYELLFRAGPENYFGDEDGSFSTSRVLASSSVFGLDRLTDGKPAFVNFTRDTLLRDFAFGLPPEFLVVEILESVEPDDEVLAACKRLKQAGYRLALDDFVGSEHSRPFFPLVDIVKVDLLATDESPATLATRVGSLNGQLLAEKVETHEVHRAAMAAQYQLFQGFFFSRPVLLTTKAIPGFRLNYLRLLQALNEPNVTFSKLEAIIKQEASMTYRFLRRVNSAAFGFRTETQSLRHALVLLGERQIRSCATVWTLAQLGKDQPAELVVGATVRGRFCELLGDHTGLQEQQSDLFLLGLFSHLETIMQRPMSELVDSLALSSDLRQALLGEMNGLRRILECVLCYERGDWAGLRLLAANAGVDSATLPTCYVDSLQWAASVFGDAPASAH